MSDLTHVVGLSGGKDSTCMALRLMEVEPRDYVFICTPTGKELPEMDAHWARLETLLGQPLLRIASPETFEEMCERHRALPSWRMRFCTRDLKLKPTIAFLAGCDPAINYVGLRADEPADERGGIYGDQVQSDYPLRRWGWGITDVIGYLRERGISVPRRTDCDRCPYQRLGEWESLFWEHPERYADAEAQEARTGHTFRSPGRDSKPAALAELRMHFTQPPLLTNDDVACADYAPCRVCRL